MEHELYYVGSGDEVKFLDRVRKDVEKRKELAIDAKIETMMNVAVPPVNTKSSAMEKETEEPFGIGDKIKIKDCWTSSIYQISNCGKGNIMLINPKTGNCWRETKLKVRNMYEISEDNVQELVGNENWEKVK